MTDGSPGAFTPTGSNAFKQGTFRRASEQGQPRFAFRSNVQDVLSTQLAVSRGQIHLVFVSINTNVRNIGWPGSLASGQITTSVPSNTWDFEPSLALSPLD